MCLSRAVPLKPCIINTVSSLGRKLTNVDGFLTSTYRPSGIFLQLGEYKKHVWLWILDIFNIILHLCCVVTSPVEWQFPVSGSILPGLKHRIRFHRWPLLVLFFQQECSLMIKHIIIMIHEYVVCQQPTALEKKCWNMPVKWINIEIYRSWQWILQFVTIDCLRTAKVLVFHSQP